MDLEREFWGGPPGPSPDGKPMGIAYWLKSPSEAAMSKRILTDSCWTALTVVVLGVCVAAFWISILGGIITSIVFVAGFFIGWHECSSEEYLRGQQDERERARDTVRIGGKVRT